MRLKGLAHADDLQFVQGVGDVLTVFVGEDVRDEVDDCAGDAFRSARPGLHRPVAQGGHEDPPDGLQGEGVVAQVRVEIAQGGDRDDDPLGDVDEHRRHLWMGVGERGSRFGITGLNGPEVPEGADCHLRCQRNERHAGNREQRRVLNHDHGQLLTYGPPR
ncbi:hypothetical protein ACFUJU_29135 [Streptomyces sp. NPDC057235]|uniref:hypothetical protein n=1 Tax=Streptomyces sp. NPDC057235 TaxID=3346058 RepID=UPI0036341291